MDGITTNTTLYLDALATTVRAIVDGTDPDRASWTWFRQFTAADRAGWDPFLVRMDDPLAYEAGTPEWRWRERVRRMVEAERARRAQAGPRGA